MDDALDIQGTDTGMHLYVAVRNGMVQRELLAAALEQDAKVYGTARMWIDQPENDNHVMIGFSAIAFEDIAPGVEALRRAWFD